MWDEVRLLVGPACAANSILMGLTLWPQDFPYLALLLIIAALSRIFSSPPLPERLWCASGLPQTVWTEAFIWMEQCDEGTRFANV